MAVWVRLSVQLDYSCRLKSAPSDAENRVPIGELKSDPSTNDLPMDIPIKPIPPQCQGQPDEDPFKNRKCAALALFDQNGKLPASFCCTKDKRTTHDHVGSYTQLRYDTKAHTSSIPNVHEGPNINYDTPMKAPKIKQTYSLQGKRIHQDDEKEGLDIDNDTPMKALKNKQTYSPQGKQIHHRQNIDYHTIGPTDREDTRSGNDISKNHNTNWGPHLELNSKEESLSICEDKLAVTGDENPRSIKRITERSVKGHNNAKDMQGATSSAQGSEAERYNGGDSPNHSSLSPKPIYLPAW